MQPPRWQEFRCPPLQRGPCLLGCRLGPRCSRVLALSCSELHLAARNNDARRIQQLLGKGEDVNCTTQGGSTPLCRAAQSGALAAMKVLLNDPNISVGHQRQGQGRSALFLAAQFGHVECVELLLEYSANPNVYIEQVRALCPAPVSIWSVLGMDRS